MEGLVQQTQPRAPGKEESVIGMEPEVAKIRVDGFEFQFLFEVWSYRTNTTFRMATGIEAGLLAWSVLLL